MLNKINVKKITATSCLAILMTGTLILQPAISSNSNNNGHGNNCDGIDSSNPGNGSPDGRNRNHKETNPNIDDEGRGNCYTNTQQSNSLNSDLVSVELVLSVDVSHSIDDSEFDLQQNGYIQAFQDSEVQQAIKNLPNGLAVNMQFWGNKDVVDIGWYKLIQNDSGSIDNLDSFIQAIGDVSRNRSAKKITVNGNNVETGGGTNIALAINEAKKLLLNNNYHGQALVIDVSGDGVSDDTPYNGQNNEYGYCPHAHFCPPLEVARDEAVTEGITINGLPIVNDQNRQELTHEIDIHYAQLVIGGQGAFVEVANDFSGFSKAAKNKILREITQNDESPAPKIAYAD